MSGPGPKKTLYIHMGMRKTGSTAIQEFLWDNEKALYREGYIFRPMPFKYENKWYVGKYKRRNGYFLHGYIRGMADEKQELNEERLKKGLSIIKRWFEEKDKVILSDETIFKCLDEWNFMDTVREFAENNSIRVVPIVFLRRQDQYVESSYRQSIKGNMNYGMIKEYSFTPARFAALDYKNKCSVLIRNVEKENIRIFVYDPKQWASEGKDIIDIFLGALDLPSRECFVASESLTNISFSYNLSEIKRNINRIAPLIKEEDRIEVNSFYRRNAEKCAGVIEDDKRYTYFTEEERKEFLDRFAESNRWVAREFFDREELFTGETGEVTVWKRDPEVLLNEYMVYMGVIVTELENELKWLQRHSLLWCVKRAAEIASGHIKRLIS